MGLEFIESHFAYIVMIDWFLDRFKTLINVSGDAAVAAVVQRKYGNQEPEIETFAEDIKQFSRTLSKLEDSKPKMYCSRSKTSGLTQKSSNNGSSDWPA